MWIAIGIIALVVSLVITFYTVRRTTPRDERGGKEYWLKVGLFFLLMVLGMAARELYNALVNTKSFNWISFSIAAIVSPMVFGAVYGSLGNMDITVPTVVLAFQNGFFWNSIFEGIGPTVPASTPTLIPTP